MQEVQFHSSVEGFFITGEVDNERIEVSIIAPKLRFYPSLKETTRLFFDESNEETGYSWDGLFIIPCQDIIEIQKFELVELIYAEHIMLTLMVYRDAGQETEPFLEISLDVLFKTG